MGKSNFIYDRGTKINVGNAGDNDLAYGDDGDPVTDTGQSGLTFERGVGISYGFPLEDFESFNIGDYTGNTGFFGTQTNYVKGGTTGGYVETDSSDVGYQPYQRTHNDVVRTLDAMSAGNTWSCWVRTGGTNSKPTNPKILWFHNGIADDEWYEINFRVHENDIEIVLDEEFNRNVLAKFNLDLFAQEWFRMEWSHDTNGDIEVTIADGPRGAGSTVTANDSTYLSGGIGFGAGYYQNNKVWFDQYIRL